MEIYMYVFKSFFFPYRFKSCALFSRDVIVWGFFSWVFFLNVRLYLEADTILSSYFRLEDE